MVAGMLTITRSQNVQPKTSAIEIIATINSPACSCRSEALRLLRRSTTIDNHLNHSENDATAILSMQSRESIVRSMQDFYMQELPHTDVIGDSIEEAAEEFYE